MKNILDRNEKDEDIFLAELQLEGETKNQELEELKIKQKETDLVLEIKKK